MSLEEIVENTLIEVCGEDYSDKDNTGQNKKEIRKIVKEKLGSSYDIARVNNVLTKLFEKNVTNTKPDKPEMDPNLETKLKMNDMKTIQELKMQKSKVSPKSAKSATKSFDVVNDIKIQDYNIINDKFEDMLIDYTSNIKDFPITDTRNFLQEFLKLYLGDKMATKYIENHNDYINVLHVFRDSNKIYDKLAYQVKTNKYYGRTNDLTLSSKKSRSASAEKVKMSEIQDEDFIQAVSAYRNYMKKEFMYEEGRKSTKTDDESTNDEDNEENPEEDEEETKDSKETKGKKVKNIFSMKNYDGKLVSALDYFNLKLINTISVLDSAYVTKNIMTDYFDEYYHKELKIVDFSEKDSDVYKLLDAKINTGKTNYLEINYQYLFKILLDESNTKARLTKLMKSIYNHRFPIIYNKKLTTDLKQKLWLQALENVQNYNENNENNELTQIWEKILSSRYIYYIMMHGFPESQLFKKYFEAFISNIQHLKLFSTILYPISFLFTPFMLGLKNIKINVKKGCGKVKYFNMMEDIIEDNHKDLYDYDQLNWLYYLLEKDDDNKMVGFYTPIIETALIEPVKRESAEKTSKK